MEKTLKDIMDILEKGRSNEVDFLIEKNKELIRQIDFYLIAENQHLEALKAEYENEIGVLQRKIDELNMQKINAVNNIALLAKIKRSENFLLKVPSDCSCNEVRSDCSCNVVTIEDLEQAQESLNSMIQTLKEREKTKEPLESEFVSLLIKLLRG